MVAKRKRGAGIRRRNPESRSSEAQELGLAGWRHRQISHCEKFEQGALEVLEVQSLGLVELAPPTKKAKLDVPNSLYLRIVRNARNGDEWTRPDQCQSNQTQPNPIKKNGPARLKAQAVRPKLARTNLHFGRARWMRGNAERLNGKAKGSNDCNTFFIYDTDERGSGISEQ